MLSEINAIRKPWKSTPIKVVLCYPNEYRAGIASLAIQTLYHLFNKEPDILCERYFHSRTTSNQYPSSIESNHPIHEFDVIAFSLQYETDYFRFIQILSQVTSLPLSQDSDHRPLILIGGPCATANPFPLLDYFDIGVIGEIEPVLDQILEFLRGPKPYHKRLHELQSPGIFQAANPEPKQRQVCMNLNQSFHPVAQVRPLNLENKKRLAFGDAFLLAPSRGCPHKCRFCLLSTLQRPLRHRSLNQVLEILDKGLIQTQTKKVALIASSLTNYPDLAELCWAMNDRGLQYSLSSARVDYLTEDVIQALQYSKQKTVTIAPETGTDRLRQIVNKPFTNDRIYQVTSELADHGISRLRLYYMIGLPTETYTDIEGITQQMQTISQRTHKKLRLHMTVTPFIPKAHTVFQWAPQPELRELKSRYRRLVKANRGLVKGNIHGLDPRWARIQAILSIGDYNLTHILKSTALEGGSYRAWQQMIKSNEIDIDKILGAKELDKPLPWNILNMGISNKGLITEYASIG